MATGRSRNDMLNYSGFRSKEKTSARRDMELTVGYNTKSAMNMVRIVRMGIEILRSEGVVVKRPDAEELLGIRNGAWTWGQVAEYATSAFVELDKALAESELPETPDVKEIESVLCGIIYNELVSPY
jgi:hypothetical protein